MLRPTSLEIHLMRVLFVVAAGILLCVRRGPRVCTALGITALACNPMHGAEEAVDLLVYGATPGGIAAAVAGARGGRSVVLVEPTARIGGMVTNGLSYSDFRTFESLSGFFLDFSRRVESEYRSLYGADSAQVRASFRGTHGEPSVNLRVFEQMLAESPRIRVITHLPLVGVEQSDWKQGRRRLVAARFRSADGASVRMAARMFVDGSYEGDLMAQAGEPYHIGRESRAQYGEPLAGNAEGRADGQVQGYNLRLIMTTVEGNKLMPMAPDGYRREDFLGVLPHFTAGRLKKVFSPDRDGIYRAHLPLLPNGKADVNDTPHAPVRMSLPDINDGYPDGDAATRRQILREHVYHNVGLLYFLQNDAAVPDPIRVDARKWGFCRDEFVETGGVPPQMYIREARRMVGQHVFTGRDTVTAPGDARAVLHVDSIAIGDYVHNCHGTGRTGTRFDGKHEGEFYHRVQPYQIPFGVIVPQRTENLLVPVACSASHFGFSALRLEPIWASLGQAAGWAAHLALDESVAVQKVDVPRLQRLLHADHSATIYISDVAPGSKYFSAVQWWGLRGGFHGLVNVSEPPQPKFIGGQYSEAFPAHEASVVSPLSEGVAVQWQRLLPPTINAPVNTKTRGDWLLEVFSAAERKN